MTTKTIIEEAQAVIADWEDPTASWNGGRIRRTAGRTNYHPQKPGQMTDQ